MPSERQVQRIDLTCQLTQNRLDAGALHAHYRSTLAEAALPEYPSPTLSPNVRRSPETIEVRLTYTCISV